MNTFSSSGMLALRMSVTDRCQLRCRYCMPEDGINLSRKCDILSFEEINTFVAYLNETFGIEKVRISGGEPLVRPGIGQLVRMLAAQRIPEVAMTSNGILLTEKAAELKAVGLSRINISLDALTPGIFSRLTGGGDVQTVLAGIKAAQEAGLAPIKLNAVVIGGVNDTEALPLLTYAIENNCELRFIELMPIGPGAAIFSSSFVSSAELRRRLSAHVEFSGMEHCPGSSAVRYKVRTPDGKSGTAGFISSCSAPFCAGCRRLRLTADGRLIGCLARDGGISIREMLRSGDMRSIAAAVFTALGGKRNDADFTQNMAMASVGG